MAAEAAGEADDKLPGRSTPLLASQTRCVWGKLPVNFKVCFETVPYCGNTLRYDWNIMSELYSERAIVERL